MSETDEAEATTRAEWLHKHNAHKDWRILSVSEIAVIRDELLVLEREREELAALLAAEKATRNSIIEKAVKTERELAEAREALRSVLELANDIPDEALDAWKNYFHTTLEAAK